MKLTDFFPNTANKIQDSGIVADSTRETVSDRIPKQIQALTPGNVLQGEVVEKSGSEVKIKIAGDFLLAARLDQEVNVEEGRLITFEVKNNGKSLSLSPLFANTASADNVMKALSMANLPVNGKTVEMTELMMKQGMSVDSHSLLNMFKDVTANGQIPVNQIVKLHQMQIPVNDSNALQLQSYLDMTHQLLDGFEDMMAAIPDTLQQMVAEQGVEKGVLLLKQILSSLFPEQSLQQNEMVKTHILDIQQGPAVLPDQIQSDTVLPKQEMQYTSIIEMESKEGAISKPNSINEIQELISELQELEDINTEEESTTNRSFMQNSLEVANQSSLDALNQLSAGMIKRLVRIVKAPAFLNLMKKEFKNQWSLSPEQVSDKEQVRVVYERVRNQLENLKDTLDRSNAGQSSLAREVNHLRQSIDFMNQLNQVYTYIQLPLKMNQKAISGELYVFTDRKSLAKGKDAVSALLHLNMENLGMVDVYIGMQNSKISTRFTVKNDDMLDFMNQHMDILDKRLSQKGYSLHCEMRVRDMEETKESPIDILSGNGNNGQVLAQYAFDVRA